MAIFKRVCPGDPITAIDYNAIAEQLERFSNLDVANGGHLRLWSTTTGKSLALAIPQETIARLAGNNSPYSWTEVLDAENGAYNERPNASHGSANAYEVNGVSNLDGSIVWLTWSAASDWRFQWVGHWHGPLCETGRICLTIDSDGCVPQSPVFGATVTVSDSTEPPNVVGAAVTTGQITTLSLLNPGSGYTDGTDYPLGITGDGSEAAGTFDVIGGQISNLTLTAGGTGYTSASITFPDAGPGTGAIGSAIVKGRCCIPIPAPGTYNIKVQLPGAADISTSVNAICNQDNHVSVSYPAGSLGTFCVSITNCGAGYSDLPVFVSSTGNTDSSGTTDSNGVCYLSLGAATSYSYSITSGGGLTFAGDFFIDSCATTTRSFSVVQSYYFLVQTDPNESNKGCTGLFRLYEGIDISGRLLLSQPVTIATDGSGLSQVYANTISDILQGDQVFYELIFPNYSFSGNTTINCTGPSTPDIFDVRSNFFPDLDTLDLC